ncbi:hypothetical protein J2X06_002595 [Lysobacter niastensis]|uniref:Uncharacterized protein n=1 Tax=Lysobacter niastensis TaxID=380629 RepID=A0ABU1WCK7_9GAMM|nr:hypothetical protein [Lysobacter niastensis]
MNLALTVELTRSVAARQRELPAMPHQGHAVSDVGDGVALVDAVAVAEGVPSDCLAPNS